MTTQDYISHVYIQTTTCSKRPHVHDFCKMQDVVMYITVTERKRTMLRTMLRTTGSDWSAWWALAVIFILKGDRYPTVKR